MSVENLGSAFGRPTLPSSSYSMSSSTGRPKPPPVNIQTGGVTSFGGQNYVTTQDLQNAVSSGVQQTMNFISAGGVTHYL